MQATLTRWGNSQGLRIPREICARLGARIGSVAQLDVNEERAELVVRFEAPQKKYARSRKMSMQEFAAGWTGGKTGEEWGGPDVGAEVVE